MVWRYLRIESAPWALLQQYILSAVRECDHQIHQDKHQVVVPAISFLSPKSGVPGEDFLLDRSHHERDLAEGGLFRECALGNSLSNIDLRGTKKDRKALRHSNALRALLWILQMVVATGDEHEAHHQTKQEAKIREAGKLWEHVRNLLSFARWGAVSFLPNDRGIFHTGLFVPAMKTGQVAGIP